MFDNPNLPTAQDTSQLLTREEFQQQYSELSLYYTRLAKQVSEAFELFLEAGEIPFLDVTYRVKDADSGYKKFIRPDKNYSLPFVDITDWCGIRIICYYTSDIERICEIVRREFDVISYQDTADRLEPDAFGYRSVHFVAEIKHVWTTVPTFRGLNRIKIEIQIRTILMHAWAEIEHKLKYKSAVDVPRQFQRQLYRLSAKFEESDEQFELIRAGIEKYREEISVQKTTVDDFRTSDVNLETVQAFIGLALPMPPYTHYNLFASAGDLVTRIERAGMSMSEVVDAFKQGRSAGEKAARTLQPGTSQSADFPQIDTMHFALAAASDKYYEVNIVQARSPTPEYVGRNIYNAATVARASVAQGIADGSIPAVH